MMTPEARREHLRRIGTKGGLIRAQQAVLPPRAGLPKLVAQLSRLAIKQAAGDFQALADRAGVSRATLRNWRRGVCDPKLSLFLAAADVLGYELRLVRKREEEEEETDDPR
jgi:transcriptional regulator with XRE-family HTH domain